ncbi:MAG: AraC family transcriptional regulator [Lachnospiraceae bacterium]
MNYEHEVVVPRAGMPFRIDIFEGRRGNYTREPHWHNSVELFAVYEGSLTFIFREKQIRVDCGDFIIINTNELHSVRADEENMSVYVQIPISEFKNYLTADRFISFDKKGKGSLAKLDSMQMKNTDHKMMQLIRNIYDLSGTGEPGHEYEMLRDYYAMMQLLVTIYRQVEADDMLYRSSKALQRLSPITEYIKKHYAEDISLQSLAQLFGYSIEHLSRMFQKYAQINYKSYLSGIRLEHAVEEMEMGDKTIGEIATEVGFSDSRAMSKAFQKKYGMLPSEYNRKNRENYQKNDM